MHICASFTSRLSVFLNKLTYNRCDVVHILYGIYPQIFCPTAHCYVSVLFHIVLETQSGHSIQQKLYSSSLFLTLVLLACGCSIYSQSSICSSLGGQCSCPVNVTGRTCDSCDMGTYNLTTSGCTGELNLVGAKFPVDPS